MTKLKELLQNIYDDIGAEDFEAYSLPYELHFQTLPVAYFDDGEPDTEAEFVEFENCEILDINFFTNTIRLVAGGDWQQPVEFTATLKDDGSFYHDEDSVIQNARFRDGFSTEDILKMIDR